MHRFEADLEQAGAENATLRDDGQIHVESPISWRTLDQRTDYDYTLVTESGGAREYLIMLEPVERS